MKRLLKVLLSLLVVLLLLGGAAFVALSLYVGSEGGRARIEAELSRALGVTLQIRRASLGWGSLRVLDVRIVNEGETFLQAPAFSTGYEVGSLLQREVVLRKMVLESPTIVWPQDAQGKWALPMRVKEPKTSPSKPKEPGEKKGFQVNLDTLEIHHGSIELLDENKQRFALAQEIEINASLAKAGEISADATAASLSVLQNGPTLEQVHLPFQYGEGKLTIPTWEGKLGGGSVRGHFAMETKSEKSPFDLTLALENVDLARAIPAPEWQIHSGRLRASLDLHGTQHNFGRGVGRGELHVTDATVDALEPLLRLIGVTCHVPELATLKLSLQTNLHTFAETLGIPELVTLREASTTFELKKEETVLEHLLVDAGDLQVGAKGTISDKGTLALKANLNLSEALSAKLPTFVRQSMVAQAGTARQGIDFEITGKNDRPKTNLIDKLLGQQIGDQFGDIVGTIFGGRKEKDKEKEKQEKEKKDKERAEKEQRRQEKDEKKARKDKEKEEKMRQQEAAENGMVPPAPAPAAATPDSAPPTPASPPSAEPAPAQ